MCRSVCEAVVSHVPVDRGGGFAIFDFMEINDAHGIKVYFCMQFYFIVLFVYYYKLLNCHLHPHVSNVGEKCLNGTGH